VVLEVGGPDVLQTGTAEKAARMSNRAVTEVGLPAATRFLFWLNCITRELLQAVLGDDSFDSGDFRFRSAVAKRICQCRWFVLPSLPAKDDCGNNGWAYGRIQGDKWCFWLGWCWSMDQDAQE
jgi:hypothetical protein